MRIFSRYIYILFVACLFLQGANFAFAAGPYSPGSTLMPDCAPGDTDCTVSIIPDQSGNSGKVLKTDGSALSWADTLSLDTVTFTGSALIPGIFSTPKGSDHSTTGSQNDVAFGTTSLVRYTGNNTATFTGVSGGSDGRMIRITNASSYNITLKNQDSSSTAGNRIITTSGSDLTVPPNVSVTLQYDSTDSRWRVAILPATSATISNFAYIQNGNSFGNTAVLGTNDAYGLDLRTNGATALSLDTSGNVTVSGDLHINGDDLFMNTNSSGAVLVADGTNFNPVIMSGDATIAANGALTINYSAAQSADASTKGFLTAADWNTFNNKQAALGFTAEDTANKSTNTSLGTSNTLFPTQNAVKTYVDNLSLGLNWQNPVEIINVIGNASSPIGSPANLDVYIIDTGGTTGAWSGFSVGDMVQYQTNQWVFIKAMAVGDRFGVSFKSSTSGSGDMTGKDNYLAEITGGSSGNFTYTFTAPTNSDAVYVQNQNAYYHNVSFVYSESLSQWVQMSAAVDYSFSNGLTTAGTVVSLGTLTADWNQTGNYNITTAGDINLNGGDLITSGSSATLFNTNATTLSIGGAATAINLGASGAVVAGAGALTLNSGATAALTIDSGTTGALNLGTGNNAKTINLGTGTAGNTINIGTNNTTADTIAIGSALDSLSLTSTGLNVTTGGALTGVASIDTIAHSATAITFAGTGSLQSTGSNALTIDSGTTGALNLGTGNNAKTINLGTGTAGNTINIGTNNTTADTIAIGSALDSLSLTSTGLNVTTGGALTGVASIDTIAFNATTQTFAGVGTINSTGANALTLDSGTTGAVNLGTGSNAKTITVGNTTGASRVNVNAGTGGIYLTGVAAQTNGKVVLCIDKATKQLFTGNSNSNCNTSSERFKHDIVSLDSNLGLEAIEKLRPVSYVYNDSDVHALGFIAEEVAQVDGRPVILDGEGNPYALDYDQIIPIVAQGMKELSFGLTNVNAPLVDSNNNKTFVGKFFDRLIVWLGSATNGIKHFFAEETHQKTLCVGEQGDETCITKSQLDTLLQNDNQQINNTPQTPDGTIEQQPDNIVIDPNPEITEPVVEETPEEITPAPEVVEEPDQDPEVMQETPAPDPEPAPESEAPPTEESPTE